MKMTKIRVRTLSLLDIKCISWCGQLGHLPSLASPVVLLLYKKKTSGRGIRRTPDVKLRLVGFNRFVVFNFGQIQLLRFVVVMVRSNSFGHLDLVK